MKIVETIVNESYMIEGVVLEGKAKEFGDIGNGVIKRSISLNRLVETEFKNLQVECKNKKLYEKPGFKLKSLPTKMYLRNGRYKRVDNKIELLKRYLYNGKLYGFQLKICGDVKSYKADDVIKLAVWLNPVNFVVRKQESGTKYIAGKKGCALENLPEEEICTDNDNKKEATKNRKKATRTATKIDNMVDIDKEYDMCYLYDLLDSLGGFVINLPNVSYVKTVVPETKTSKEFIPLGIGEIAEPHIDYTEKNMNANTNFKKVGKVDIYVNGQPMPIYTYTHSNKKVFINGESYIKRFGIGINEDKVEEFKKKFSKSLAMKEIKDKMLVEPIRSLRGDTEKKIRIFEIDTSQLEVISKKKAPEYLLDNSKLLKVISCIERTKVAIKYYKYVAKSCGEYTSTSWREDARPKYGIFAMYNDELLSMIVEAGVDIFKGDYVKVDKIEDLDKDEREKETQTVNKVADFEVIYKIKGLDSTPIRGTDFGKTVTPAGEPFLTREVRDNIVELEGMNDLRERRLKAIEMQKEAEKKMIRLKEMLWKSRYSGFILGNKDGLVIGDREKWEEVSTRAKNAVAYQSVIEGVPVTMTLKGITLK